MEVAPRGSSDFQSSRPQQRSFGELSAFPINIGDMIGSCCTADTAAVFVQKQAFTKALEKMERRSTPYG